MFKLIYVRCARTPLTVAGLLEILEVSRSWNDSVGITGVLLYCDGNFMRLLEGPEDEVRSHYSKIVADQRHRDVTTIFTHLTEDRWMQEWSMAFAFCANKEELEGAINLAKGLKAVENLIDDSFPLRSLLIGFVERNLRLIEN